MSHCAKETYVSAKEPYISAKEPYTTCISAQYFETPTYRQSLIAECFLLELFAGNLSL